MAIHQINGVIIHTSFDYPPIPVRTMDWSAVTDDYDADCDQDGFFSTSPVGHGATEEDAIEDLLEQLEEDDPPYGDLMKQFDETIEAIKRWVGPLPQHKEIKVERAILSVDGDHGCALLGENLQEGEAEFVKITPRDDEHLYQAEVRACFAALNKLRERLGRDLTYAWYPRRPGSAGA